MKERLIPLDYLPPYQLNCNFSIHRLFQKHTHQIILFTMSHRKGKRVYPLLPPVQNVGSYQQNVNQTADALHDMHLHNVPILNPEETTHQELESNLPMSPSRFVGMSFQQPTYQPIDTEETVTTFNELYTVDLMNEEKQPSIGDLQLPPPPVIIPTEKMIVPSESANASTDYIRSTLNAVPKTKALYEKLKIPFALEVKPYQFLHDNNNPPPLSDDGIIVRCRRCRAYINPFINLVPNSRRWRCNFCKLANDLPPVFNLDPFDQPEQPNNIYNRKEIQHSVVEFLAPPEYSSRPPPPVIYSFIIDVSYDSIKNGTFSAAISSLLNSIDMIPNYDGKTLVSIACVNSKLHYFKIPLDTNQNEQPKLFEVADIEEPFLPTTANNLLFPLALCKEQLTAFLQELPNIFGSPQSNHFALGSALNATYELLSRRGGKIVVVSSSLPDLGPASLTHHTDKVGLADTTTEYNELLRCSDTFYKQFAIQCSKSQISIDLFLTGSKYLNIATVSNLARYTGGQTYYYPEFSERGTNGSAMKRFETEFNKYLSMDFSMDTVMRARTSRGVKTESFYGHFFNRSSDVCAFSSLPRDQSYVFQLALEDNILSECVYVQIALLFSLNRSERRIRTITLAIPTTSTLSEVYASVDQLALFAYYTKVVASNVLGSELTIPQARDWIESKLIEVLTAFQKASITRHEAGETVFKCPSNMKMLPLLMHCLTKSLAFQPGDRIPIDLRANALNHFQSIPLKYLIRSTYPTVYSLHEMTSINEPLIVDASLPKLENYGLYLIDNGYKLYLWVGGFAVSKLVEDVFGVASLAEIPIGEVELPFVEGSSFNSNVSEVIQKIRNEVNADSIAYQPLYIVIGPSPNEQTTFSMEQIRILANLRVHALNNFVEDSIFHMESYSNFLQSLKKKI